MVPAVLSQQSFKMAKKRSSMSLKSSSSSSRGGGGGTVWLDVQEDGELEGGTKLGTKP